MRSFRYSLVALAVTFALGIPCGHAGSISAVALTPQSLIGTVNLGLNGTSLDVDSNVKFLPGGIISYTGAHKFDDGNITSFSINANPDPNIVYGLVFGPTPGPGPNNYTFDFSQPFLGSGYDTIHQDFSGSATFSQPGVGGSITNINVKADVNGAYANGVNLLGFSCSSPTNGSIACGQGSATSSIIPVSSPGTFSVHFETSIPGNHDVATFNGQVELSRTSVPEPASFFFLGSGFLMLSWLMKRRLAS